MSTGCRTSTRTKSSPLDSASVDVSLAVAAWQYWTEPEAIASELLRVTRPGGSVIVAFSNRMFFPKSASDLDGFF